MRRWRPAVAAALAALLLASCTAGPDYHGPQTAIATAPAANGPFVAGHEAAYVQAPLPDRWWTLYADPRLDAYEREALAANADLRAADANLRRASEIVRQVQLGRSIQTRVEAGAFAARVGGYTLSLPLDLPYSYSVSAAISYPLDLAGGIRRGIEAARDDAEAVQAARDQVRVTVAAAVARNYAAICSANVSLAATNRVLAIQSRTLSSIRRLFAGGRGTSFDITRARAAYDRSAASVPAILASRQAALFQLAALLGRPPAAYPRELESCASAPALRQRIPIGDGSALIRRRPDIRAAERELAAATANIGVEIANRYPQVRLTGSLGFANAIAGFADPASFGALVGPMISWVFPNRQLDRARIRAAGFSAETAADRFDATVLEALRQTETALTDYAREIDRDAALERARADAERATDQANRLFRFGRTDVLNVLTAQAQLAEAEATLASSHAVLVDRQINVFLALGGGWGPTPGETGDAPAAGPDATRGRPR